jgi:tryptophan-rich sensory protein
MKGIVKKMKRNVARESVCINTALVIICAAVCAVTGLFFTLGGIDPEVYGEIVQPKFYLPPFFMIFFNIVFYALLGAAAGIVLSTPYYRKNSDKALSLAMAACTLFLCFAWISLVYTAARFFVASLVSVTSMLFYAFVFKYYIKINVVAAWIMLIPSFFSLYLACYSLSLFILN